MKKCPNCEKEFEPITYRGNEQVYCSKKCRTRQGNLRHKEKLKNNESNQQPKLFGTIGSRLEQQAANRPTNVYQRTSDIYDGMAKAGDNSFMDRIEKLYDQRYQERIAAFQMEQQLLTIQRNNEMIIAKLQELQGEGEDDEEEDEGFSINGVLNFMERFPILQQPIASILSDERVKEFVISMIPPQPQKT